MIIDSHCHLNYPELNTDASPLSHVLERARRTGVEGFLTINTQLSQAHDLIRLSHAHKNVACTVGVHPHEAASHQGEALDALLKEMFQDARDAAPTTLLRALLHLAQDPYVVGIGETGLDYYYNQSPKDAQRQSFAEHIQASCLLNKPLVIHTRDADLDTIEVLDRVSHNDWGWTSDDESLALNHTPVMPRGVFHCFSGTLDLCKQALDRGFYISISGIVTFKKAENVHEVARYVPLDRLLIETDAPYLAPVPHRGQTNEPAFVVHTAERIAEIRGLSFSKLCDATTCNFFELFKDAVPLMH